MRRDPSKPRVAWSCWADYGWPFRVEAESRGLEFEVVGSVTRGLGLRGGYAWTSTEITRVTSALNPSSERFSCAREAEEESD